jgi:hypothetical protein
MAVVALVAGAVVETARWRGWLAGDEFVVRYWKRTRRSEEPTEPAAGLATAAEEPPMPPITGDDSGVPAPAPGTETATPSEPSEDGDEASVTAATEADPPLQGPSLGARMRSWRAAPRRWSLKRGADTLSAQSEGPSGEQPSDHHP